jgi:hypothetical protein
MFSHSPLSVEEAGRGAAGAKALAEVEYHAESCCNGPRGGKHRHGRFSATSFGDDLDLRQSGEECHAEHHSDLRESENQCVSQSCQ